jgi:hypothetical protein
METFIIIAMLYFLVLGLTSLGLVMTNHLPIPKEKYRPASKKYYYLYSAFMIGMALVAALVL